MQGQAAIREADLVLIPRKGADKADLADIRREIVARALGDGPGRIAEFDMPVRDAAAPYLRQLVAAAPDTDFARLWRMLAMPVAPRGWTCQDCGREDERVRWFCPACRGFHTYLPGTPDTTEA